jgi:hypothetical protein
MFHLNKMSLKDVINTNLALNPLLTRGEKANSVIPHEITMMGTLTDPTNLMNVLTDGEASFSAFQFRMAAQAGAGNATEYYNIVFPTTNDLAYNPRLYPVLNVISGDTGSGNLGTADGYGAVTARILYRGNYLTENGMNQTAQAVIQITRAIGKGETLGNAIVEVRLVEMPINDVGLNADAVGVSANQIRDTVIVA